jgi:hypothetical protein
MCGRYYDEFAALRQPITGAWSLRRLQAAPIFADIFERMRR